MKIELTESELLFEPSPEKYGMVFNILIPREAMYNNATGIDLGDAFCDPIAACRLGRYLAWRPVVPDDRIDVMNYIFTNVSDPAAFAGVVLNSFQNLKINARLMIVVSGRPPA